MKPIIELGGSYFSGDGPARLCSNHMEFLLVMKCSSKDAENLVITERQDKPALSGYRRRVKGTVW